MTGSNDTFASSEKEAERRYKEYKNRDPFPDIEPALLSSAHIQAYIAKTGMIHPYSPSKKPKEEPVTSACITLTVGPEVLYWDENNVQRYSKNYSKNDEIKLRPNSITFLRPKERVLIPDYIAMRFNLRITHVHRGLLLGTGPLLDPGFKGYPMIPVHNLTENEYIIYVGEEFINVEVTKISKIDNSCQTATDGQCYSFQYKENKKKTLDFEFTKYIKKNVPNRKVKSSLSGSIDEARKVIKKQKRTFTISIFLGGISLAALIIGGFHLVISTSNIIDSARGRINISESQTEKIEDLEARIKKLEKKLTLFNKENKKMDK